MLVEASDLIKALTRQTKGGISELKVLIALARPEVDARPFFYARPAGPLSELRTPRTASARIFRPDGGQEILLTAAPLDCLTLSSFGLHPASEDAREAMAEELAPALAVGGGLVLSKPDEERGAVIHRTGKYAAFQLSFFDPDGFSQDWEVKTLAAGLLEAARMGYTRPAPALLDRLMGTDRFAAGNERTAVSKRLLRDELLHTVEVATMRFMTPHEFAEFLGRVEATGHDSRAKLARLLRRWDAWNEAIPPDAREHAEHDDANRAALTRRVAATAAA